MEYGFIVYLTWLSLSYTSKNIIQLCLLKTDLHDEFCTLKLLGCLMFCTEGTHILASLRAAQFLWSVWSLWSEHQ